MFGTEVSKFLKNFLLLNGLEGKKDDCSEKIFLSKCSSKFGEVAKKILNREIEVQTE